MLAYPDFPIRAYIVKNCKQFFWRGGIVPVQSLVTRSLLYTWNNMWGSQVRTNVRTTFVLSYSNLHHSTYVRTNTHKSCVSWSTRYRYLEFQWLFFVHTYIWLHTHQRPCAPEPRKYSDRIPYFAVMGFSEQPHFFITCSHFVNTWNAFVVSL